MHWEALQDPSSPWRRRAEVGEWQQRWRRSPSISSVKAGPWDARWVSRARRDAGNSAYRVFGLMILRYFYIAIRLIRRKIDKFAGRRKPEVMYRR